MRAGLTFGWFWPLGEQVLPKNLLSQHFPKRHDLSPASPGKGYRAQTIYLWETFSICFCHGVPKCLPQRPSIFQQRILRHCRILSFQGTPCFPTSLKITDFRDYVPQNIYDLFLASDFASDFFSFLMSDPLQYTTQKHHSSSYPE